MKVHRVTIRPAVLAAGLLLISPLAALAAAPAGESAAPGIACGGPEEPGFRGPPWGPMSGPMSGPMGRRMEGPMGGPMPGPMPGFGREWGAPPFLAGLKLTDEQQDKVFSILYAAAPAVREQEKALRKAHEALGQLGTSADYDEARAKALIESATKAGGQLTLLRLRTEHDIFVLLTPEQRAQVAERRQRGPGQGGPDSHEGKPR